MARTKYQKDENGRSILGSQEGLTITRPWNMEMYNHNDKVAEVMKANAFNQLTELYESFEFTEDGEMVGDEDTFREFVRLITIYGFGHGYEIDAIYERACVELERMENYLLNEQYEYMVNDGFCQKLDTKMVGYDKL